MMMPTWVLPCKDMSDFSHFKPLDLSPLSTVRDDIQFANKGGGGCGDGCLDLSATVSLRKAWERQTLLGATNLRLREFVDDH